MRARHDPPCPEDLERRYTRLLSYVREKTNELLGVLRTKPLRPGELDEEHLLEVDPIGTVAGAFGQVLEHLETTNERLRLAYGELEAIFASASTAIVLLDPELRIRACNPAAERRFGHGGRTLRGRYCHEAICRRGDAPGLGCSARRAFRLGRPVKHPKWQAGDRVYEVDASPVPDASGAPSHVVLIYLDVTEREQASRALAQRERWLQDFLDNASDLIQSVSPEGKVLYVNRAWRDTLGYGPTEIEGMTVFDVLAPSCQEHCRDLLAAPRPPGETLHAEVAFRAKDGHTVHTQGAVNWIWREGKAVATRGLFRDMTELRRAEEERRRRHAIESLGVLAGGIAHDFNNVLAGMVQNLELASRTLEPDHPARGRLALAEQAAYRARGLTQQLLTFAKGGEPRRQVIDLPPLVEEATRFALSGSPVGYDLSVAPSLAAVEADPQQITQVVQNLVLNAAQAMGGRGTVRIRVEGEASPRPRGAPAVCVSVTDSGPGIPDEVLPRIFDPYFTTKPDGTGLGLAIVHSVLTRHGGGVAVESIPGRGTTARFWLPASPGRPPEPAAAGPAEEEPAPEGKRILLMDDEELILDATADLLEMEGFEVATAPDGDGAVAIYRRSLEERRPFDAVILDLTVPGGKGGLETLRELAGLDPGVRAIASSGYSDDPVLAAPEEHGFRAAVSKPYRMAELVRALRKAFDSTGPWKQEGQGERSPCPRSEPR